MCKMGGMQSGVCSGVLWLAAAVAPIKGDPGGDWTSGSPNGDWASGNPGGDWTSGDPGGDWTSVSGSSPVSCWLAPGCCSKLLLWVTSGCCADSWEGSVAGSSKALSNDSFNEDSASRHFCSSICCCKW